MNHSTILRRNNKLKFFLNFDLKIKKVRDTPFFLYYPTKRGKQNFSRFRTVSQSSMYNSSMYRMFRKYLYNKTFEYLHNASAK